MILRSNIIDGMNQCEIGRVAAFFFLSISAYHRHIDNVYFPSVVNQCCRKFVQAYIAVCAVGRVISLYVYDTESFAPILIHAGLHYATITDIDGLLMQSPWHCHHGMATALISILRMRIWGIHISLWYFISIPFYVSSLSGRGVFLIVYHLKLCR